MKRSTTILIMLCVFPLIASASLLVPISSTLTKPHKTCSAIETHTDQCAFVTTACHGFSGVFLKFYYCSTLWKPLSVAIMLLGLLLLFGAVSVVAADFFCPNLQTISSKLQLSESMAGVTILAFGNGSPDLFSTFSAMNSGSGSLAIGELIGAAFFIVSVVSGCMGIIRPFRSKRITFMRDASFLTGAIIIMTWIVYHQRICWYHGLLLICYYVTYVIVVVMGAYRFPGAETPAALPELKSVAMEHCDTEELLTETSRLLQRQNSTDEFGKGSLRLDIPVQGFASQEHLGHVIRPVSPNSSHVSRRSSLHLIDSYFPRTTSTNGSISSRLYRHAMSPRIGIRTSVFSAIEFQEQVASIKRANSTHMFQATKRENTSGILRQRHTQASVPCISARNQQGNADHLLTPYNHYKTTNNSTTPESSSYNTATHDYFTYISANQHRQQHQQQQQPVVVVHDNAEIICDDQPIPEIRLAPPNNITTASLSSNNNNNNNNVNINNDVNGPESLRVPLSISKQNLAVTSTTINTIDKDLKQTLPIYIILEDIFYTLFPTLQDWRSKTTFAKLNALVAVPLVFVFTITLPVAESEQVKVDDIEVFNPEEAVSTPQVVVVGATHNEDAVQHQLLLERNSIGPSKSYLTVPTSERSLVDLAATEEDIILTHNLVNIDDEESQGLGWCRWLVATQAVCSTTFVVSVMALNGFVSPYGILVGFFVGCVLSGLVLYHTNANEPPKWHWMLSFMGFVIALNWIFLLANEMVGLLQALGAIFDISEAIMGLTIFALGNSVGDFVANTAIAKMGFPTMAISACYAGPLLNMVLGVGISSTYQAWISGKPYELDIAPTILISSVGLITVLLSTLIVVNINGYHITEGLGWWMIIVYSTCTIANVLIEFHVFY